MEPSLLGYYGPPGCRLIERLADDEAPRRVVRHLAGDRELILAAPYVCQTDPVHGDLAVAVSGVIDNGADLIADLGRRRADFDSHGQSWIAAVLLEGYATWQSDLFTRVVGDFVVSVWDGRRQQVVIARDALGVHTCFYSSRRNRDDVIWSDRLRLLLDNTGGYEDVDPAYLADFIVGEPELGSSPFRQVKQVPPGELLVVQDGAVRGRRYWHFDLSRTLLGSAPGSVDDQFRQQFRRAVERRLEPNRPVVAELSGGYDSGSIVCVADALLKDSSNVSSPLHTVSYIVEGPGGEEELRLALTVQERTGRPYLHVRETQFAADATGAEGAIGLIPIYPYSNAFTAEAVAYMDSIGARTLLRGIGGDVMLWSMVKYPPELADYVISWQWRRLQRDAFRWARALERTYYDVMAYVVRQVVRHVRRRSPHRGFSSMPFLTKATRERPSSIDPWPAIFTNAESALPSKRIEGQNLFATILAVSSGRDQEWPIRVRYPFLDRQLIELCLAIPTNQKIQPGEMRLLHRRALSEYLPAPVVRRNKKIVMGSHHAKALHNEQPRIKSLEKDGLRLADLGLIDAKAFFKVATQPCLASNEQTSDILTVVAAEHWLRADKRLPAAV
jgi:asparagine synthase (glutamine-hydrolysing)